MATDEERQFRSENLGVALAQEIERRVAHLDPEKYDAREVLGAAADHLQNATAIRVEATPPLDLTDADPERRTN